MTVLSPDPPSASQTDAAFQAPQRQPDMDPSGGRSDVEGQEERPAAVEQMEMQQGEEQEAMHLRGGCCDCDCCCCHCRCTVS
ncbi:hypothetical protein JCM6882_000309 [Rhodosporidiobolus microsporus]